MHSCWSLKEISGYLCFMGRPSPRLATNMVLVYKNHEKPTSFDKNHGNFQPFFMGISSISMPLRRHAVLIWRHEQHRFYVDLWVTSRSEITIWTCETIEFVPHMNMQPMLLVYKNLPATGWFWDFGQILVYIFHSSMVRIWLLWVQSWDELWAPSAPVRARKRLAGLG